MKKLCALLAIVMLILCFNGCGAKHSKNSKVNPGYSTEIPSYTDDKEIEILAFWSPPINETQYNWMKECGITAVVVDNKYESYTGTNRRKILTMCEEMDIDVYFPIDRETPGENIYSFEKWLDYPAFKGFYCDEPITRQHMDNLAKQIEVANELDPNLKFITNLICGYPEDPASFSWRHATQEEFQAAVDAGMYFYGEEEYFRYFSDHVLKDYTNVVFSNAAYPLLAYDKGYESTLMEGWLSTLCSGKKAAQDIGINTWQFIATTAYHNGDNTNYHRQPTEADIRWQSYVVLACGANAIEEFVYTTTGPGVEFSEDDYGPIWWYDQNDISTYYRTDVYYSALTVHQELAKFDHVLLSFDWKGILTNVVTEDTDTAAILNEDFGALEKHKRIDSISSSRDLLIGCFEDDKGYDGFLVVNFEDTLPYNAIRNDISIEFDYATKALVYVKGEEQLVELKNHTYTCTLSPGDGVFIIPIA